MSHPSEEEVLRALDGAAERAEVDGGTAFAGCQRVVEQAREATGREWLNELEQVLWILDDGLQDPSGPEPTAEVARLAADAAIEWRAARAPGGEGAAVYAGRWLSLLRQRFAG